MVLIFFLKFLDTKAYLVWSNLQKPQIVTTKYNCRFVKLQKCVCELQLCLSINAVIGLDIRNKIIMEKKSV
jgi:hypothetical protein